jgi:hypothetical protein
VAATSREEPKPAPTSASQGSLDSSLPPLEIAPAEAMASPEDDGESTPQSGRRPPPLPPDAQMSDATADSTSGSHLALPMPRRRSARGPLVVMVAMLLASSGAYGISAARSTWLNRAPQAEHAIAAHAPTARGTSERPEPWIAPAHEASVVGTAAPPVSTTLAATSSPRAASSSGASAGGDTGVIHAGASARGRRVYVDDRVIGEGEGDFTVPCGPHKARVGSKGINAEISVPCGGAIEIK